MIGAVVDGGELLSVVGVSLAAGLGVTGAFAVAIVGGTRAVDMSRDGRGAEAAVFGLVGLVAFVAVVAAIVLGILALTSK